MNMPASQVTPQTPWKDFAAIKDNGWNFARDEFEDQADFDQKNNYCLAFEDLGISSNYQNFIPVDNYHKKTRGSYRNMFNLVDGVITGEDNHSPDYHIQRSKKEKQAPPLKQWSDLVFIDYQELQHQTRQTGEKIEHFIRNSIENKETLDVIRAARNDGLPNGPEQNPPELSWEWNIAEKGAHAIMGTANGAGVAYFLAQHKDAFGIRSVDRIHAFNCHDRGDEKFYMCLYFHVAEGPLHFEGEW
ncbi:hypothetical protein CLAFUW4_11683 [Fulvia fulva]|uniref:Uncharacterized protein n=1 Tax=Passalora fulva TaxID=5499 RepID=A0A9Q8PC50_PASFU|nr:uncharacterized protein CLAFUR5_10730 [Fulvia fulva]KAK4619728.1 hypothetical protein CLAFUR4_11688 [Fulvia fulva]KAK4620246.1 hypothetical protein CLAFUR0_11700 [Fulvia fulva]UJO19723.1 hypothetical protein CLAFUR5_10730 [Fulvia fulva]WPV16871.1 hypothetical protein CLAFUW4_11683 [Fulvia fulva]WPV32275.1 hypothetical protein CLAFUW7_11690 [Fulvia fulva]